MAQNEKKESNPRIREHRVVLYCLRLWGVFFFVDGAIRFVPQVLELAFRVYEGKHGPYTGGWPWYWWFEYMGRPVIETAAGAYLLWGGAWLANLIVRRVKTDARNMEGRDDTS
jgi:hypothetical protein